MAGRGTIVCYFYLMEYLRLAPAVRLHGAPQLLNNLRSLVFAYTGTRERGRQLSILWVPVLLLIAIICIPLPFPTGLPLVVLALSLVLSRSRRAKVKYIRLKRTLQPGSKLQRVFDAIDKLLRMKHRKKTGSPH